LPILNTSADLPRGEEVLLNKEIMESMNPYVCIAPDVKLGNDVKLSRFVNLYGCEIGDETKIGAFVEIQKNARLAGAAKSPATLLYAKA
jgi:acyl-[acyl carrier protein]--UDP-N-acetylglucosamine O-acyltransferase